MVTDGEQAAAGLHEIRERRQFALREAAIFSSRGIRRTNWKPIIAFLAE
jgi:hypothetical protein